MTHTQPAPSTTDSRISEVKAHSDTRPEGPPGMTTTSVTATVADRSPPGFADPGGVTGLRRPAGA
jgi:hypothetical protein